MNTREQAEPFVSLSQLSEIELLIVKQMQELTLGEHRSVFHGSGFDFVGLREWQPGDRPSTIDWPQSTITNFSPLIVRDFEQRSTGTVVVVADNTPSTRCGMHGNLIAASVARAIGTIGMSAVFFQDPFGLISFDANFRKLTAVRPRTGKTHVVHCLDAYQNGTSPLELKHAESLHLTINGFMRKTTMIPVVSDFLFENAPEIIRQLALLNVVHDVFIVLIESAFAFDLPHVASGWIKVYDVETGRSATLSRRTLLRLADRACGWQEEVERAAKTADLDVVRLGQDDLKNSIALSKFTAERRLRKK
jgi:uncharacterized protein (DUF58 family)